jgi:predicted tellurium resistance membrane protein TerC
LKGAPSTVVNGVFWATVASIEMMDLAFSVDSILAALALVTGSGNTYLQVPVLLLGGMLGILMMRGVAGVFLKLLERVPELEVPAHLLIALIATKMFVSVEFIGIHIPHVLFFGITPAFLARLSFTTSTRKKHNLTNQNLTGKMVRFFLYIPINSCIN